MNEKIKKITELIAGNETLKNIVLEIQRKAESEGVPAADYAEKLAALLGANGIDVSAAEILPVLEKNNLELSDDELDNVSGGCGEDKPCNCYCDF